MEDYSFTRANTGRPLLRYVVAGTLTLASMGLLNKSNSLLDELRTLKSQEYTREVSQEVDRLEIGAITFGVFGALAAVGAATSIISGPMRSLLYERNIKKELKYAERPREDEDGSRAALERMDLELDYMDPPYVEAGRDIIEQESQRARIDLQKTLERLDKEALE